MVVGNNEAVNIRFSSCRGHRPGSKDVEIVDAWLLEKSYYLIRPIAVFFPLSDSCYTFFFTMTKLGFIMGYFFLCDRANFFMKENKHFTHINFFLPVAYVAALGFFFHDSTDKTRVI